MDATLLDIHDTDIPARQTKPKPVELRTARDYSLTTQALTIRAEDLKKLAKKTREEGYTHEARNIEGDAGAIEHYILPRFKEQQELPLVTADKVRSAIANAVHGIVHKFAVSSDSAEQGQAASRQSEETLRRWQGERESNLEKAIAVCVEAALVEAAAEGFAAGLAARENSPEHLALRSVDAMHTALGEV